MKEFTIRANPAKRFTQEVTIVLPDDLDSYDAEGKDFPPNLPTQWTDPGDKRTKRIEWITNFGLTQSGKPATSLPAGKKYTVRLPGSNRLYVYWDGNQVRQLAVGMVAEGGVEAELDEADPPIGWT